MLVITVDNTTMNQSFISKNFVIDFLELTDNKTYLVLNIFEFFSTKLIHCSFRYLLWTIKRHLRINSKNGYQIMDSLLSIFSKYWTTFKFPDIAFKINLFQDFVLISCKFYLDLKKVFNSQNLSNQLQSNVCWRSTTMNPCSGGSFWN